MDQGPLPLAGDFGGLTPEPPPGFLPQPPPPNEQLLSQRASPEFISSQGKLRHVQIKSINFYESF